MLYGCVPLMADPLEGMPIEELPELAWPAMALRVKAVLVPLSGVALAVAVVVAKMPKYCCNDGEHVCYVPSIPGLNIPIRSWNRFSPTPMGSFCIRNR